MTIECTLSFPRRICKTSKDRSTIGSATLTWQKKQQHMFFSMSPRGTQPENGGFSLIDNASSTKSFAFVWKGGWKIERTWLIIVSLTVCLLTTGTGLMQIVHSLMVRDEIKKPLLIILRWKFYKVKKLSKKPMSDSNKSILFRTSTHLS